MKAILFLLLWLPLAVGCKKNEINALPPATQEGRNTLGFLLDGKAWVPDGGGLFTGIKPVEGGYQGNFDGFPYDNVWIRTARKDGSGLDIYLRTANNSGVYLLNQTTQIRPTILVPQSYAYYHDGSGKYLTNNQYTGSVTITKADPIGGTIAGIFSFAAKDYSSGRIITVTEGRFDVNIRTQ